MAESRMFQDEQDLSRLVAKSPEDLGLVPEEEEIDLGAQFESGVENLSLIADQLQEQATPMLSGELPDDVVAQIRNNAAEAAIQGGLGLGQAARNLEARDLGLTSIQLQQQGVQTMQAAAQIREVAAKTAEARRQFTESYRLDAEKVADTLYRTDLTKAQLAEETRQFNAKTALAVNELVANLTLSTSDLQYKFAATSLDGDMSRANPMVESINSLIEQLTSAS